MSQHSEPEKKPGEKPQEAPDTASSGALGGLGSEATRRLFRYYNSSTGKCDLTEEQADEKERRREIYNRAVDEELERRRQERLERWRNTPLDPEAKEALDGLPPQAAWSLIQTLVYQAFEVYADEAQKLMEEHQPEYDQDSLGLMLQNLNPVVGINNFQYVNQNQINLKDLLKAQPLKILELVLEMVTTSDKWLTRGSTY